MGSGSRGTDYICVSLNDERRVYEPSRILTREMEEGIQDCLQCHRICLRTFSHLRTLELDAELAEPEQLNLLLDCADLCRVSADFMLRISELHVQVAELCCKACRRCQQLCELPSGEDPIVLEYAATCARCANSCKRVVATSTRA
jgi:hypothetical protein